MGKYFTVEVKPVMTNDASTTSPTNAYTDKDIMFDWHAFDVPKGGARLLSITSLVRGTDGADQLPGATTFDYELIFAKDTAAGAPSTLGVDRAGVLLPTVNPWFNNVIGRAVVDSSLQGDEGNLIYMNIVNTDLAYNGGAATYVNSPLVLQGNNDMYRKDGYDRLYVAGIALGAFDFNTGVLLNETDSATLAALGTATLDVDGTDVRKVFAIGDEIIAQDGAEVGTIKSMTHDGTDGTIVLESAHTDALANNDEFFHKAPITLIFHFEK